MVLQSYGAISLSQVRTELKGAGASGAISMSQLYEDNSAYLTRGIPSVPTTGSVLPVSSMYSKQKALTPGLTWKAYSGYFGDAVNIAGTNDDVTWFASRSYTAIGLTTDFTNIATATNNTYTVNGQTTYSVEWFGYFRANATGTWTFGINSDDAGYVWIGSNALSGYTVANSSPKYPGLHGASAEQTATVSMTSGTYYPIRIQFGQNAGGVDCSVSFTPPSGSRSINWTGYAFSSTGGNVSYPAESAQVIRGIFMTNSNGVYYVNVNGSGTAAYCMMDTTYDGGGWMMLLKATRGSTFTYASTYWTGVNTLNPTDTTTADGDAKYNTYNYSRVKDLLAIWPDMGVTGGSIATPDSGYWTWLYNNCYSSGVRAVGTSIFTQDVDASPATPSTFAGFNSSKFSLDGYNRHVIGNSLHLYSGIWLTSRWGFVSNGESDWGSCDNVSGIGLGSYGGSAWSPSLSSGSFSWGTSSPYRVMIFGR